MSRWFRRVSLITGFILIILAMALPVTAAGIPPVPVPTIYSISPSSGPIDTVVTLKGQGFTTTKNQVNFGSGVIVNISSSDGHTLVFTVPKSLTPACAYFNTPPCPYAYILTTPGAYAVSVKNAWGTSNKVIFKVTAPLVYSLSPTSGRVGTNVTVYGYGFTATNNQVNFGSGVLVHLPSADGKTLNFTVPKYLTPACAYSSPPCPFALILTTPGNYAVSVTNANGTSNKLTFTVTN